MVEGGKAEDGGHPARPARSCGLGDLN
jgi:hypothetical protein